jgi:hypothetical protein
VLGLSHTIPVGQQSMQVAAMLAIEAIGAWPARTGGAPTSLFAAGRSFWGR